MRFFGRILAAGAALPAALIASSVAAQSLSAADPEGLVAALQSLGYRATLTTDGEGDPKIESATGGVTFHLYFYGCDDAHLGCTGLQLSAGFDQPTPMTASDANKWNFDNLFGEMTVDDEGDPRLSYFFTTDGGLNHDTFADILDWWEVALGQFLDYIDW
ncbi:YbjN domain-containing protein [Rhodovulum euryhalinum]|uniref:Putative sensory transduction regulator n=1 Tax=Rhodovulum euryhalinum TaxID=35805 RepID=A0A4R2KUH4_9RHOB|nr:YbjN domain-containing protein [Rhodovulum euryhalinum]TCO70375.1 putative sensory transduction regulator [Rhodovulum euryhalinum]